MSFDLAPFGSLFSTPQKNGLTRPKSVRGSGVPMVNMNELFAFSRIHNIEMDLVPIVDKESHFLLETEDLLFARQSLVLAGAGKCSIFIGNTKPTVFESHIIRCRLNKTVSNPYFYYYFFQSVHGRIVMETIAEQGAGASGIRGSDLVKLLVPCPSKSYQDAIVKILTPLDDRISLLRETNTTLEAIAKTLFKSWFVDFDPVKAKAEGRLPEGMSDATAALFPSEFEESALGLIPKGWRVEKLGEVIPVKDGTHESPKPTESGYPLITSRHITSGKMDFDNTYLISDVDFLNISKRSRVDRFDVLITMIGTVGIPVIVLEDKTEFAIKNIGLFKTSSKPEFSHYLYLLLLSSNMKHYIEARLAGTTQKYVSLKALREIEIILPSGDILSTFSQVTFSIFDKIHENDGLIKTLTTLRDTLLPRLISGQLRLNQAQDLVDEVAS